MSPEGKDGEDAVADGEAKEDGEAGPEGTSQGPTGDGTDVEVVSGEVEDPPGTDRHDGEQPAHEDDDQGSDRDEDDSDREPDRDGELERRSPPGGLQESEAPFNYEDHLVRAAPDLARLGVEMWVRGAFFGVRFSVRASGRLVRAAVDPRAAAALADEVRVGVRRYAREFLGINELAEHVERLTPVGDRFIGSRASGSGARANRRPELAADNRPSPEATLQMRGAELLRQSADVASDDAVHPAYSRILNELAPDEGRILRLLSTEGPQPVVDVRAANLIGVGSQLVAAHLNMVGAQAGCRHPERVHAYVTNLQRLGLASYSDKPIEDPGVYQVLEAQPRVMDAIKEASRAKTTQKSLRLTDFGTEFCRVCFPQDPDQAAQLTTTSSETGS